MVARSIGEVRSALTSGVVAERFAAGFSQAYFGRAMGSLPKSEIDLLVFGLLVEHGVVDASGSIFGIARALNITPAKARGLLFQYQLRFVDEAAANALVLKTLAVAKYAVDDKRLSFGIESPLARAAIDGRLKEQGVFADISLSGDILRVPLAQFAEFITILMGADKARELEQALKKDGHLKDTSLQGWLSTYGTKAAEGAAGAAGKQGFASLFNGIGKYLAGDGLPELGNLIGGLG